MVPPAERPRRPGKRGRRARLCGGGCRGGVVGGKGSAVLEAVATTNTRRACAAHQPPRRRWFATEARQRPERFRILGDPLTFEQCRQVEAGPARPCRPGTSLFSTSSEAAKSDAPTGARARRCPRRGGAHPCPAATPAAPRPPAQAAQAARARQAGAGRRSAMTRWWLILLCAVVSPPIPLMVLEGEFNAKS